MRRILVLVAALVVSGCTVGADDPPGRPTGVPAVAVVCAPEIRGTVLDDVRCNEVTVPGRGAGTGAVVVHVTRVGPPRDASGAAPVVVLPTVASTPNYLGISTMAQRTGREIVILDARGTGHSSPSLDCPEVTQVAAEELVGSVRGIAARDAYLEAVDACGSRLRDQGVDPSAFTFEHIAADVASVRTALGIERWHVVAFGSAGRLVPELMRIDGDAVDSVILDAVELPDLDPVEAASDLTPAVVRQLLTDCAADRACARRYPDPDRLWDDAVRRVGKRPIALDAGPLGTVPLDGSALVRVVRAIISDGGSSGLSFTPSAVPAVLAEVARGGGPVLAGEIAPLLAAQDPFCLGYLSDCLLRVKPAAGAYFSMHCSRPGLVGFRPGGADPLVDEVLSRRLDPEVCERWGVEPAGVAPAPLSWTAPTLVVTGAYAPYAPTADLVELVAALPAGSLLVDPGGADNVLPRTECMLTLRRRWLDAPVAPVETPACLKEQRVEWYLPGA